MKQTILYLAEFLGNIINYSYSYFENIKKKLSNSQLVQLRVIISLLFSLCIFYFHLGSESSGWFSYFYFISSIIFSLFTVVFLGLYFHRTDPDLNFSLYKYSINDDTFECIKEPSLFLNKNKIDIFNKSKHSEKEVQNSKIVIRQGPGGTGMKYFAIKYVLIQHFYKEEKLETLKYPTQEAFLIEIGKVEKLKNPLSLKKPYASIKNTRNIENLYKNNYKIINLLYDNKEFESYPLVNDFIESFRNKRKKN